MTLYTKQNRWECMPYAFAMACDLKPDLLIDKIGHDGSEILYSHLEDPMGRRGFHAQECVLAAWYYGYRLVFVEIQPILIRGAEDGVYEDHLEPIDLQKINYRRAVICGLTTSQTWHAAATDGETVFDPEGVKVPYDSYGMAIEQAYLL